MDKIPKQHIGEAGVLLVQYKLMKYGIDTSKMTTDYGIDLVAYSPLHRKAYTIQVKAQEKPSPAAGKGKLSISWSLKDSSPADLVAVADLSNNIVWLFTYKEFAHFAQQHSAKGKYHLYMYVDETVKTKKARALISQFSQFILENRIKKFFYRSSEQ